MSTTEYSQEALAKQPIGYWSGEAHRRVADALQRSLAANGLSQPQWWILNRLADGSRSWTRAGLVEELTVYSANEEGRDVADELDLLVAEGLAAPAGGADVVITSEGTARLAAARERNGRTHRDMLAGIADGEYAVAIDVLRRIVGNLGGDPRLP